jgi:hypothetical protein
MKPTKYYIILGSRDSMTRPSEECDTQAEAAARVDVLRKQGLPAFHITGQGYKELTGHSAHADYLKELNS